MKPCPPAFRPLLTFLCLLALPLCAQTPKETAPRAATQETKPQPTAGPHALTSADVEAFLDGVVPQQLDRENIAGAVVSIVKDGQVIFEKGYGYADVKSKKPVTPTGTLFRVGSISKLFTWTSVMQLVEQGKLDLDRDVNDYLDFKIPPAFDKPITIRDLMTHTPGFEETDKDLFTDKQQYLLTVEQYLKHHIPRRIFAPGTTPAYSNYGAALAAYIVQRVSGQPFDDYVEQHIFQPLGMTHSSFRQPLPPALQPLMSSGYKVGSGDAKFFEFINVAPAGSLATSADDITHFMIAHLQDGRYNNVQILKPETAQQMHTRQTATWSNPDMNGMALGFYEETRSGHRIFGHGGDTIFFHSDLHLMPDQQLGFFVSYNSAGRGDLSPRSGLWRAFLDRYYPYQLPEIKSPATAAADNQSVLGLYLTSRRCGYCVLYLGSLLGEIRFHSGPDNTIVADALKGPNLTPIHWKEIGPLLYRNPDGQEKIAFTKMPDGTMRMVGGANIVVNQRVPWYLSMHLVIVLLCLALGIPALAIIFWIVAALARLHYGQPLPPGHFGPGMRIAVRLVCVVDLAALLCWAIYFGNAGDNLARLSSGNDWILHLFQVLTLLGVILTLIPLIAMLRSWMRQGMWWWSRVHYTLVGLAAVAYCWLVFLGHLLDWSLRY